MQLLPLSDKCALEPSDHGHKYIRVAGKFSLRFEHSVAPLHIGTSASWLSAVIKVECNHIHKSLIEQHEYLCDLHNAYLSPSSIDAFREQQKLSVVFSLAVTDKFDVTCQLFYLLQQCKCLLRGILDTIWLSLDKMWRNTRDTCFHWTMNLGPRGMDWLVWVPFMGWQQSQPKYRKTST